MKRVDKWAGKMIPEEHFVVGGVASAVIALVGTVFNAIRSLISNYLKLRFWKSHNVPAWLSSVGTRDSEGTRQHCSWSSSPHQTWSTPPWFSHSMHWQCWSQSKPSSDYCQEKNTSILHRCMHEYPFLCKTFVFLFYWSFTSLLFLEASIDYK